MNRLRLKLVLVFVAATVVPLGITVWLATSLIERSLSYASPERLEELSRALEKAGREFYQQSCETLKREALAGKRAPARYARGNSAWPAGIEEFWESREPERFLISGEDGDRLEYLVRRENEVWLYARPLGIGMTNLSDQYRQARRFAEHVATRDLRRGFIYTFALLAGSVWLVSLGLLVFMAHRVSQLQQNRDRLVYMTQLASWQMLARKMAHELKNSLTPIRLTMEEIVARQPQADRAFLDQAAQVVADEIDGLERRVRAFSEFAAEPPLRPAELDVNALVDERISFLRAGHPEVTYLTRLDPGNPRVAADEDLLKGILTNLLENAAEAAGTVLAVTSAEGAQVFIEVHDSGPGLSKEARQSLFEPTISFKRRGMGLGLSIARKNALVSGGDILLVKGELGGAGFRVALPRLRA